MSVLSGHWRYAHISAIRGDGVNPELLGMKKVASEDVTVQGVPEVTFEKNLKNLHFGPGALAKNLAAWIFESFGQKTSFRSVAREGTATSGP